MTRIKLTKVNENLQNRTALLSVYNKDGIVQFAKELVNLDFKIYASAGTAKVLSSAGVDAADVADLTGGGAIFGHRVVTLSREVYAGLLSRDIDEDKAELERLKIPRIDLVCVDLYPLEEEIRNMEHGAWNMEQKREKIIEKTDIGGPTLLRAAAKGSRIVICNPADRLRVISWLQSGEPDREKMINELAAKAEFTVANYTLISAKYHSYGKYDGIILSQISECKYGENGWQVPAGLFADESPRYNDSLSLSNFQLVAGTAPSYNNLADVDRLLQTATHIAAGFDLNFGKVPYLAVGVKHGNACGVCVSANPSSAIQKMLEGDLRAIFGGVVLVNFEIDERLAEVLLVHRMDSGRRLLDGIVAPSFTASAIELLKRKGDKCRFLANPALAGLSKSSLDEHLRFRYVRGGFLRQPNYTFILDLGLNDLEISEELSESRKPDIILAWAVGSTSNSNTVTIVKDGQLLGNGVGQQDRVGGCELAVKRARDGHHDLQNAAAYSDSFFPFPDGLLKLIEAGVKTIFATRGSVKDEEVKKVCAENHATFITLPDSKARGFFGH
ncbi:MAG: hypothetical protein HYZ51_03535 [Candidatus Doudnabacteria bacterium]|nr:hypothetical protein [Candidatus Doudnabacteria bacterium]